MINKENEKKKQTINILLVPRIVRGCEETEKKTSRSRLIKAFANFPLFFFFFFVESPGAFQELLPFQEAPLLEVFSLSFSWLSILHSTHSL